MSSGGPRAEILAIGDELTHGITVDTNSAHVARALEEIGYEVGRVTVVADEPQGLTAAIAEACARAAVVIGTGGLGPTEDDRTRAAAAAAAGVALRFDEAVWRGIEARFRAVGLTPPASNRLQAEVPAGAEVLANDWGTAPGFALRIGEGVFYALPGVPREMRAMLAERVLPALRAAGGVATHALWELHLVGVHEAELGERIGGWMGADANPRVGITAKDGVLTVRIVARGADADDARARCARTAAELRPRCAEWLLHEGGISLAARVVAVLAARGARLALAESCTAGLVAATLGAVPGCSEVLEAGWVTYSNAAKHQLLGVGEDLIERHGAVSVEVAEAMARGAAARARSRFGLAITGIAGPGGGTADKPVGTVCFALADGDSVRAWRRRFTDLGRDFVRRRASVEALAALLRAGER